MSAAHFWDERERDKELAYGTKLLTYRDQKQGITSRICISK